MSKLKNVIEGLKKKGFIVNEVPVNRNGVIFNGVSFRRSASDLIAPTIYPENIVASVEKIIDYCVSLLDSQPKIDLELLRDAKYVSENLNIGLVGAERGVPYYSRPSFLEGINEYLMISIHIEDGIDGAITLTKENYESILKMSGITIEEAWIHAERNTLSNFELCSMFDILIAGMKKDEDFIAMYEATTGGYITIDEFIKSMVPAEGKDEMYVLSNRNRYKGASAIINKDVLLDLINETKKDGIIIIPSSIHEFILVPVDMELVDRGLFDRMVSEVNSSCLDPLDILSDRAFLFRKEELLKMQTHNCIYTYEFSYDIVDGFGSVRFCAGDMAGAAELWEEFKKENGLEFLSYDSIEKVYDTSDAEEYGISYVS